RTSARQGRRRRCRNWPSTGTSTACRPGATSSAGREASSRRRPAQVEVIAGSDHLRHSRRRRHDHPPHPAYTAASSAASTGHRMSSLKNSQGFSTRAIHAGQRPDPTTGAVMTPIYATSTYAQESPGVNKGYEYARGKNPTREAFEACLADL